MFLGGSICGPAKHEAKMRRNRHVSVDKASEPDRQGFCLRKSMPSAAAEYWSAAKAPSSISVLLIEDDPDYSELVRHLLDGPLVELPELQFSLLSANTLSEGLARLSDGEIQVVLLDLTLPDSTGLQT